MTQTASETVFRRRAQLDCGGNYLYERLDTGEYDTILVDDPEFVDFDPVMSEVRTRVPLP